jgi:hypothetical protein
MFCGLFVALTFSFSQMFIHISSPECKTKIIFSNCGKVNISVNDGKNSVTFAEKLEVD